MTDRRLPIILCIGLTCAWMATAGTAVAVEGNATATSESVDFNRDIRPILSENCYACHGPDKGRRKADLRLDTKDGLLAARGSADPTVVPRDPDRSELYQRIVAPDPDERMPDPRSGKSLTPRQIALIKTWIEQGAGWKGHWAFLSPTRTAVPTVGAGGIARNPIDRMLLARLDAAGLRLSPEADRVTLIRRLYFDLAGLPPTMGEVKNFSDDPRPDAYERLVSRLLDSPRFGERMAMDWLDLVRYADSAGYHSDNDIPVSPYRDYVIRAFNENKPFDRFTIEQLAGDLLPDAGPEQKVASTYNRLLMTTEEGGAQAKEYEAKYAGDRVRNVSTVWLGTTMGCAQCHDHKFDPFSSRDFYRFAAFFADIQEAAVGSRGPGSPVLDGALVKETGRIDARIAEVKAVLETSTPELAEAQADWESNRGGSVEWTTLVPVAATAASGTKLAVQENGVVTAGGPNPAREIYTLQARAAQKGLTAFRLEVLTDPALAANGPGRSENGNFVLTEFTVAVAPEGEPARTVTLKKATADFSQNGQEIALAIDGKAETGWAVLPQLGKPHSAVFEAADPIGGESATLRLTLEQQSIFGKHTIGKFRLSYTTSREPAGDLTLPAEVRSALSLRPERRDAAQKAVLSAHYRSVARSLRPLRDELRVLQKRRDDIVASAPKSLVSLSGPARVVRVLRRGNWQDDSGEVVTPAVPHFMRQLPESPTGATRLDLARWVVARDNPLTARVAVNRFWKQAFGQGLAKTLDDLGAQGEWPTHPELLDWLAVELMDSGWNVKHLMRLLVTSAAYRQTSLVSHELKERDPYNRLVARQARFRVDAETVRDNALAVSGLLVERLGGRSVKPYQPAGYWDQLNFPPRTYVADRGESQYRRGVYTHWQRSFLHPSLQAFDAPTREECTAERTRSNIPQQALALLNDPTYVEAARSLAERILREGGGTTEARVGWAFARVLSRSPLAQEAQVLTDLASRHSRHYSMDREGARKLLATGQRPTPQDIDISDLAAWTSVARVLLNLHETITRP